MALSIDGHVTGGNAASASSAAATLTTTNSNDVIVLGIWLFNSSTTVSSISGGGLTWARRGSPVPQGADGLEVWWAAAASPLSATVITVNFSGATAASAITAFGVNGANTVSPWDVNASLPKTGTGTGGVAPSVSGVSTTAANTMLLGFSGNNNSNAQTAGASFTLIDTVTTVAGASVASERDVVSSAQSSISVAFGTSIGGGGGSLWAMIADAIVAGAASSNQSLMMTGLGS